MEIFTAWLLILVAGSIISVLIWLLVREKAQTAKLLREQAEHNRSVQHHQLKVIERSFAQLRATNAWEYQAIVSMDSANGYDVPYDPSEEAEAERIAERNNKKEELEETLSAEESAVLDDIFPGGFPL